MSVYIDNYGIIKELKIFSNVFWYWYPIKGTNPDTSYYCNNSIDEKLKLDFEDMF